MIIIKISFAGNAAEQEINWYSYQKGIAAAKTEDKKIFLHFYADWCVYCKIMNNKTFKDTSVVEYLNKNFISIRVNSDKERELAQQYKVRGLPTNWFLMETNEKIASRPGYIPPSEMILYLKFIKTDSYQKMTLKNFMNNRNIQ
jgi:thioredoxin-related protein